MKRDPNFEAVVAAAGFSVMLSGWATVFVFPDFEYAPDMGMVGVCTGAAFALGLASEGKYPLRAFFMGMMVCLLLAAMTFLVILVVW